MGIFDRFRRKDVSKEGTDSNTTSEEQKEKFVPFGSLLKDKSGTFPRREKENLEKNEILVCSHCGEEFSENQKMIYAEHMRNHEFLKQGPIVAVPEIIRKQENIVADLLKKTYSDEDLDKLPESPQTSVLSRMLRTLKGNISKEKETALRKQIDLQDLTDRISLNI